MNSFGFLIKENVGWLRKLKFLFLSLINNEYVFENTFDLIQETFTNNYSIDDYKNGLAYSKKTFALY
jgi:hypothetical protein